MKIGFLLPSLYASKELFPDRIFAPLELAVHTVDGLVKNGHEVIVFSVPDFSTTARLVPGNIDYYKNKISIHKLRNDAPQDRQVRTDEVIKRNFELAVIESAFNCARKEKLDIIHSYHDFNFISHYFEKMTGINTAYTLHDPLPPQGTFEYQEFDKFKNHHYVTISNSQRKSSLNLNYAATVYHGVNLTDFEYSEHASDYLLFMGRLVPEKGLHHAIKVALATNIQLEIGTQFPDLMHKDPYFETQVKPYLDNPVIGEPGMVQGQDKIMLYKQAQALLFPIEWEEPFGMVLIEAMACGTPVIAFNRGSVAEIVRDGVTGFIVDPSDQQNKISNIKYQKKGNRIIKKTGVEGLIEAVKRIGEIDRKKCRQHVAENFTTEKMVEGYVKAYQKIAFSS